MITSAWLLTFWLFVVGWFCCCTTTGHICTFCAGDSGPTNVSVTFGGIVDGACDCDQLNTTYIVPPETTNCWYYGTGDIDAACGYFLWPRVLDFGATWGWQVELQVACTSTNCIVDIVRWRWDSGAESQFDCSAARTLTFYSHTTFGTLGPNVCDQSAWSSTTCQVN